MSKSWKTQREQVVYDNAWITVRHADVIAPTGHEGIYGTVHYKHFALGILPLDKEYNTWLVGQYRYPLRSYSWEIPEGGGKVDAEPLPAAQRELAEEVGLTASHWRELQRVHLSNSVSDELGIIYLATGLEHTAAMPDETEVLTIRKLPLAEAYRMVENGEITDTMSVIAILKVQALIEKQEI